MDIYEKLNLAGRPFEDDDYGCYRLTLDDGRKLTDILAGVLEDECIHHWSVDEVECFDSPGCTKGCVSLAWIDHNGTLGHEVWEWHD